jgi:hypothetical protein
MIRISLIIAGLYAGSSALADETDLNPGWIITDVSECLEASSRGVFVDYKAPTTHTLKFEMGNKGYGAVCQTVSYRFFYKEREYNLVSITDAVPPKIADQIPADAYEALQENCMILAKSNSAVCDYKSFKGNSTTYAHMDEVIDLFLSQQGDASK